MQNEVFLNTVLEDSENESVEAAGFMLQTNSFVILWSILPCDFQR